MSQNIEEIKHTYEGRYAQFDTQLNKREIELYRKYRDILLVDCLNKKNHIKHLDLGCGKGHKTLGFLGENQTTLAVDISENAISNCQKLISNKNIEFKACDALKIDGEFDLITAFGFSLFNTPNNDQLLEVLYHFIDKNLSKSSCKMVILGSFTDFSGTGENSWYLHTQDDLDYIKQKIESDTGLRVSFIFPHKLIKNYLGFGVYNTLAEVYKLVVKRRKTFFIRIEDGQG